MRLLALLGLLLAVPAHAGPLGAGAEADHYRREGAGFSRAEAIPAGPSGADAAGGVPASPGVAPDGAGPGSGAGGLGGASEAGTGGAAGTAGLPGPTTGGAVPGSGAVLEGGRGTGAAAGVGFTSGSMFGAGVFTTSLLSASLERLMVPMVPMPTAVPEPASLAVLGAGLLGLLMARRVAGAGVGGMAEPDPPGLDTILSKFASQKGGGGA